MRQLDNEMGAGEEVVPGQVERLDVLGDEGQLEVEVVVEGSGV